MTTLAKALLILIVGFILLALSGNLLRFASDHWVAALVIVLVLLVVFQPERGSNRVLRGLFAWASVVLFVGFLVWYFSFQQSTERYIVDRLCHMDSFNLAMSVCRFLGVRR